MRGVYITDIVDEIKKRLSIFKNLYDVLRIVDPISKMTFIVNDKGERQLSETCYGFWEKQTFCKNCVSMRAFIENDTCVKIEVKEKSILLIIATPVYLEDNEYIVEMLKDISKEFNFIKSSKDIQSIGDILSSLNDKVVKDDQTGIYNKRYINERLPVDIENSNIVKQPLAVIMADIDFFKNINDTYGHLIGDKVLSDFVKSILPLIPNKTDWMARFGGEEFLIVLNNTDAANAYEVAEKIRKTIENTSFKYEDIKINITASFGVFSNNNIKIDAEQLISNADKNLYLAKNTGRNKTIR